MNSIDRYTRLCARIYRINNHACQTCNPDTIYSVYNVHFLRVTTKGFLTAVAHVEEPIFIFGRFIHGLNQACCLRQGVIHKHEESFSRSQMQPATQNVDKLSNRHITRYQVSVAKKRWKN